MWGHHWYCMWAENAANREADSAVPHRQKSWRLQGGWSCRLTSWRRRLGKGCAGVPLWPTWRCKEPCSTAGSLACFQLSAIASSQTPDSSSRCAPVSNFTAKNGPHVQSDWAAFMFKHGGLIQSWHALDTFIVKHLCTRQSGTLARNIYSAKGPGQPNYLVLACLWNHDRAVCPDFIT